MYRFSILFFLFIISFYSNAQNASTSSQLRNIVVKYKSDETNNLILNYKDSTYSYSERSILKPGDDVGYNYDSRGTFKIKNDTLQFLSQMPSEIDINDNWNTNTEFLPIYSTNEKIENGWIKIYFDNIAEPENYVAYEYNDGKYSKLKIKDYKSDDNLGIIKTGKLNDILLFQYLIIEKPKSNKLLIVPNGSGSFFFDLKKIPYNSFHFFTRAYWSYYDFTGLKFLIKNDSIKLVEDKINRNQHTIITKNFVKQ